MAERITDASGKEFVDLASHERVVAELADVRLAYVEAMERESAQEQQQQRPIHPVVGSPEPLASQEQAVRSEVPNTSTAERLLGSISELRVESPDAFMLWKLQLQKVFSLLPQPRTEQERDIVSQRRAAFLTLKLSNTLQKKLMVLPAADLDNDGRLMSHVESLCRPNLKRERFETVEAVLTMLFQKDSESLVSFVTRVDFLRARCENLKMTLCEEFWCYVAQRGLKEHLHRSVISTMDSTTWAEVKQAIQRLDSKEKPYQRPQFKKPPKRFPHSNSHRAFMTTSDGQEEEDPFTWEEDDATEGGGEDYDGDCAECIAEGDAEEYTSSYWTATPGRSGRGGRWSRARARGRGRGNRDSAGCGGGGRGKEGPKAQSSHPQHQADTGAAGKGRGGTGNRASLARSNGACYACGQWGHHARFCPNKAHWTEQDDDQENMW